MAKATRPMKLRRVIRLPARLAVLSKRWSKDMSVDLHWLVERTMGRGGPRWRVGHQFLSLGQHLLDVVEGIDAPGHDDHARPVGDDGPGGSGDVGGKARGVGDVREEAHAFRAEVAVRLRLASVDHEED